MSDVAIYAFFSRLVRLLSIDGLMKSEAIVLGIASKIFRIILNVMIYLKGAL